ncbi:MAG: efflux RND transporter periplasmic adaptor subunit [Acidithiobacillus sp.]
MKRNQWNLLAVAIMGAALLAAGLAWLGMRGRLETGESHRAGLVQELPRTTITTHGLKVVVLGKALQAQAGIRTQTLLPARYRGQAGAYGLILDPRPLLALRASYAAALGQLGVARAAATTSQREYERLRFLNRGDQNVSIKTVQAAQGAYQSDQARLAAALASVANLQQTAITQWGSVLEHWALGNTTGPLAHLFNGQDALLLVTLPAGLILPSAPPVIHVESGGSAASDIDARLVSASPQSDPSIQGETYFYLMPARQARIGMRLAVAIPLDKPTVQGAVVPASAVLWYADQAWVYLQTGADRFVRHRVSTQAPVPGGWFETDPGPGQQVVTQGAQLLLSQELLAPSASTETGEGAEEHKDQKDSGSHGADKDQDND